MAAASVQKYIYGHSNNSGCTIIYKCVFPGSRESHGLACYDFEGGSVFALPLLVVPAPTAARAQAGRPPAAAAETPHARPQAPQRQQQQLRCTGAVLLSFPATQPGAQRPPAGLDAGHARSLQLLAASLAPRAAAAAAPLLAHCNLLLGVAAAERPESGWQDEEGSDSDVSVVLTDSSEGEEDREEGEEVGPGDRRTVGREHAGGPAAEAEGEQPLALSPLPWAAGACRAGRGEPPEDPGASSAAVLAAPPQQDSEWEVSGHGGGDWQRTQQAQQAPLPPLHSPSAAKARPRVEAARLGAAAGLSSCAAAAPCPAAGSSVSSGGPQSSLGSLHSASSWGSQQLPQAKASPGSSEGSASAHSTVEVPLERLAGATWARLLRFADARLEACFAARLAAEQWKVRRVSVLEAGVRMAVHRASEIAIEGRGSRAVAAPGQQAAAQCDALAAQAPGTAL